MRRRWLALWGVLALAWAALAALLLRRRHGPVVAPVRRATEAAKRAEEVAEAFAEEAEETAFEPEQARERVEAAVAVARAEAPRTHQAAMDDTTSPWGAW